VIQWMLNNAWPSVIWHLYDFYLRPGGGYFGAKKGCEPLHIQYSYDDGSIVVVNSFAHGFEALQASAKVYNLDMTEKFSKDAVVVVKADGVQPVFTLPQQIDGLSRTYFLRLSLSDSSGNVISTNFYWLSTKQDVLDWDRSTWFYTPVRSFSDLTGLAGLPQVDLNVSSTSEVTGDRGLTHVTLENPGHTLALAVHLRVMRPSRFRNPEAVNETEILPVLWEDNYFALMPGEKRQITASYRKKDLGRGGALEVAVDGWNVNAKSLPASASSGE